MHYRFSHSGIVHRGSVAGVSDYLARGEYEREGSLAVGASNYIAREGRYNGKASVAWQGFFGPDNGPDRFRHIENAQANWYEACQAERQYNGQVADHFIINLAPEMTLQQNIWMLQDHVRRYTRDGRIVQAAIHHEPDGDPRNIHGHLLVSLRRVDEHGFVKHKAAEQQARWAQRSKVMEGYREDWENVGKRHLQRHGHSIEGFDRRSYLRQGIDRTPGLHLTRSEIKADPRIIERHNRFIRELNAERQRQSLDKSAEHSRLRPADVRARWEAERERQALDQAHEARHPEPQRVETIAKVQTPETDWQALNERNVARKRAEASHTVEKHGAGLALGAPPAVSSEERAQIEREARLDRMDSGDPATAADIARQISPAYRQAEARLEAVNVQLDRTRWNRGQLDQEAQASLYRIDERRQGMSWWETIKNIGRADPELASWRDVHDRSVRGYHRAARQERALEKEQRQATKAVNKVYDQVKPAAVAELNRRHTIANEAREKLRVIEAGERAVAKQPIDRAVEREQRARDYYREKVSAVRQAREERLQQGSDFWQQTIAAGRMAQTAKANAISYEDVQRLNETAKLDRDKWGYNPLTVEDIARELSPTFANADDRFKALTTKAENMDKAIDAKEREQQGVKRRHDQRQQQMGGMQAALDRWGPVRDRQLVDTERAWLKLDKERTELVEHRTRLADQIGVAEDKRSAELEKVRKPAEQELTDRQQRAAAARETLATYRARQLAIEQERQAERQSHQHRRGLSLGR